MEGVAETVAIVGSEVGDIAKNIPKLIEGMSQRDKIFFTAYLTVHLAHEFAPTSKLKLLKFTEKFKRPIWLMKAKILLLGARNNVAIKLSIINKLHKDVFDVFEEIFTRKYYGVLLTTNAKNLLDSLANNKVIRADFWKEIMKRGRKFNTDRAISFDANEVYLDVYENGKQVFVNGKPKRYIVDSFNPPNSPKKPKGIFSRKHTQLSEIDEKTAKRYLFEMNKKYKPGSVLSPNVKSKTDNSNLNGVTKLTGQMYLEVPVQKNGIPNNILEDANKKNIIIRNINGKEYNEI